MSDVTVIGLGQMGGALARCLLQAGHAVTVWNRSPQKAEPFAGLGAMPAEQVVDAVKASPRIIVCVSDYAATNDLVFSADVMHQLSGRTVIQLSTGSPKEARVTAALLAEHDVDYIDGAILCYPASIGSGEAQLLFAGPRAVYERCEPLIHCLGGDLRFVGDDVGAASALDMAVNCYQLSAYLGVIHGALICESEDIGVERFASLFADGDIAGELAKRVSTSAFDNPGATLNAWSAAAQHMREHADASAIDGSVPAFIVGLCQRAIAAGHGEDDFAALIEVLRTRQSA